MESLAFLIIRIGLAVSFLLTGAFILKAEDKWTHMILPWAKIFTLGNSKGFMISVAVFDLTLGIWLLTGFFTWLAALLAALHLIQVLIGAGITNETYRDIGLLAASIALLLISIPMNFANSLVNIF